MKKKIAIMFATCMTLSFAIGCSAFGAEAAENNKKIEMQKEEWKEQLGQFDMAQVVEVNENTVVVKLAEKPERLEGERPERPELPEGEEGERPERPELPEGEEGERPERPELPEGEEGERPEGRGMKHNRKEINFDGEEIEISLNSVDIITENGEESEINADDIIMIHYAEDGETIQNISIRKEIKEVKEAEKE